MSRRHRAMSVDADVAIGNCAHDLRHRGLTEAAEQMDEVEAAVRDLMTEARRVVDGTTGDLHYLRVALNRCEGAR